MNHNKMTAATSTATTTHHHLTSCVPSSNNANNASSTNPSTTTNTNNTTNLPQNANSTTTSPTAAAAAASSPSNNATSNSHQQQQTEQTISYSAERIIGNGSFGVVFQAAVVETGEVVAIKKVLQDKRFKNRELQIMRQLVKDKHSNIVTLKHCFYSQVRDSRCCNKVFI